MVFKLSCFGWYISKLLCLNSFDAHTKVGKDGTTCIEQRRRLNSVATVAGSLGGEAEEIRSLERIVIDLRKQGVPYR